MDEDHGLDVVSMARRVGRPVDWVRAMLVDRRGDGPGADMVTTDLEAVLGQDRVHRCAGLAGLQPVTSNPADRLGARTPLDLRAEIDRRHHDRPPPHRRLLARWGGDGRTNHGEVGNLLGHSVYLEIDDDLTDLAVPLVDGDAAHLLYYGALPIEAGTAVTIDDPMLPVWTVDYGTRYVEGHLLTERGGGFYLEWHTDRAHWHQARSPDAGGFYLLARQVGATAGNPADGTLVDLHLTAFRLRPGTAVYTRPGAIHCDAALTGTWAVGYADSHHFSTALVRNRDGAMVRIDAVDPPGAEAGDVG